MRRPAASVLVIAAALFVAAGPSSARAAGPSAGAASDDPKRVKARQLVTAGGQLVVDGDYMAALEKFHAAYALYPSPKILVNIGTTLRQLGRNVEAAEAYEAYLADPSAEPVRRAEITRIVGELEAHVGRLRIEVNEPAATLLVDGRPVAGFRSGASLRVEPGEHSVVAERAGLPPAVARVKVGAREERRIRLELKPAEVRVKTLVVEKPPPRTQRVAGLVLGGAGLAGLAAGGVLGVVAKVKDDVAAARCATPTACTQEGVDANATARAVGNASTIAFIAGGAALATGAVLFFTAASTKKPVVAARLGLTAGPAGAMLNLGGDF